ncbi:AAA family ATPase [Bacillus gobiensis]|uniref:ATP-binding protein n=1 Tax=Bacillus gobiensis TaxID=1441095 RepID=UPI003D211F8C
MKIASLHIYGYGKFINKTFHFSSSRIQIIYGINESGKTTLMNFIEDMLFGFKKQSQYKPKRGGAYGGMLVIDHEELGEVKIERTGIKNEDVRVLLQDGRVENGDFLDKLLHHMDRSLFKSIYSFDVFGLQEVHKLNREKIGQFLFFSSLFGSDAIANIDSHLKKQQDALFKPNGRKPELNRSLEELKKTVFEHKKAKSQSQEYQSIIENQQKSNDELLQCEEKLQTLQTEMDQINRSIQMKPKLEDEAKLRREIESEESRRYEFFPEDGLHLLEKYESHLHPKAAQLAAIRDSEKKLQAKIDELSGKSELLKKEEEVAQLLSSHPIYESHLERLTAIEQQTERYRSEFFSGLQKLNGTTEEDVASVDCTYEYEWKLKEEVQAYLQLQQKKKELDEQFNLARADLDEAEKSYAFTKESILNDELRKQKEEALYDLEQKQNSKVNSAAKRDEAEKQLAALRLEEKGRKKRHIAIFSALAVFCIAASVVCYVMEQRLAAICLLPTAIVLLYFGWKSPRASAVVAMMEKQLADMKKEQPPSKRDWEAVQTLKEELWLDDQTKQRLMAENHALVQREAAYERVITGFEEWETRMRPVEEGVRGYLKSLKLSIDPVYLLDAYSLMKQLNDQLQQIKKLETDKKDLERLIRSFEEQLAQLQEEKGYGNVAEQIYMLKKGLQEQKQANKKREEAALSLQHARDQTESLQKEMNYFKTQIEHLFQNIEVTNEQEFRSYAKAHDRREKIKQEHSRLTQELIFIDDRVRELAAHYSVDELEAKAADINQQLKEGRANLKKIQERIAYLQMKQQEIEKSGMESELAHKVTLQRNESKELAKKWGAIQLAREVIHRRIDYHQKVRLPSLLRKAEELIDPLTDGRYVELYFSEVDQTLMVRRKDGLIFYAHELSQATCEQLYTAIRFSLALSHENGLRMPFLMDDSFVHFDKQRLLKVTSVIEKWVDTDQQVLLFTCHGHIKETFSTGEVTSLS